MRPINIVNSRIVYLIMLFNLFVIYLNKGNNKIRYITYKNNSIYLKYNVIDINDLKKESVI